MKVELMSASITDVRADAIIVNLFEGIADPGGATGAVDRATGGAIRRLIERGGFRGKLGETHAVTLLPGTLPSAHVIVTGLGPRAAFDAEAARRAAGNAIRAARALGAREVATIVHGAGIGGLEPRAAAEATVMGSLLGAYRFLAFKGGGSDAATTGPDRLIVAELDAAKAEPIRRGIERGEILAQSVNLARDLVNTPPNHLTPSLFAERAEAIAHQSGLSFSTLDRDEMARLGMEALLAVARGSVEPPKMIVLKHVGDPDRSERWDAAFVGKGVTFDSGGLSLKPAESMVPMKNDMAGGAAVLGAMAAISKLGVRANLLALIPCVENMPSGSAVRPGDVVKAINGKTIEIVNTDAEGRLILADAVGYAAGLGVEAIVDIATLTGSVNVALGNVYVALIASDDALAQRVLAAAARSGEKVWRLPADPAYKEQYKSDTADIKNSGGRPGGTITGGLIIGEFVGDRPWAHLDIAATAASTKAHGYEVKGGTGIGVRTLIEFALSLGSGRDFSANS